MDYVDKLKTSVSRLKSIENLGQAARAAAATVTQHQRSGNDDDSEIEERPHWSKHLEFVITCVGYAVGLGNVWRFPFMAYSYGGGAFLIPYFTSLFLLGIPIFFLEIVFGQFSGRGTISAFEINPLFKGFGYSIVLISADIGIYYNVVIARAVYFFFQSFQSPLPWESCGNDWNTCYCRTDSMETSLKNPLLWHEDNGLNCSGMSFTAADIKSPSEEYYYTHVLQKTGGIDEPGGLNWPLTMCNLLVWTLIFLCISRGVQSMGKVAYVSSILPYILMTGLLIRGVSLPGAGRGIDYYMSFDMSKIMDSLVWKEAAGQILFSLSAGMGSLTAMSSFNKFHENAMRDSFVVPFINCATSFYIGFAVFATIGFMAESSGKDVTDVTASGTGLVFVLFPTALSKMPLPQIWSVLFFLMMILLGLGSQFPTVETIVTCIQDEIPRLRSRRYALYFRMAICFTGFLLGLPQTTNGGEFVLGLVDHYISMPLLIVALLEAIVIVMIYGLDRFSEDVELMLGYNGLNMIIYHRYIKWCLIFVSPLFTVCILVYSIYQYKPITGASFPWWSDVVGWCIFIFIMMWTPIVFFYRFCTQGGYQLLKTLNQPTVKWGPARPENRTLSRYKVYLDQLQRELELEASTTLSPEALASTLPAPPPAQTLEQQAKSMRSWSSEGHTTRL